MSEDLIVFLFTYAVTCIILRIFLYDDFKLESYRIVGDMDKDHIKEELKSYANKQVIKMLFDSEKDYEDELEEMREWRWNLEDEEFSEDAVREFRAINKLKYVFRYILVFIGIVFLQVYWMLPIFVYILFGVEYTVFSSGLLMVVYCLVQEARFMNSTYELFEDEEFAVAVSTSWGYRMKNVGTALLNQVYLYLIIFIGIL